MDIEIKLSSAEKKAFISILICFLQQNENAYSAYKISSSKAMAISHTTISASNALNRVTDYYFPLHKGEHNTK